jgi:predicted metal-dependent peptidase
VIPRRLTVDEGRRFTTARSMAVEELPYLASAVFTLQPWAVDRLGTFAVDREWNLYLDPANLEQWTSQQSAAVIIHEAFHLLRDHGRRLSAVRPDPDRADRFRWNCAADAEINDDLCDGALPLPDPVLPETLGAEPGRLAEEYYEHLTRGIEPDSSQHTHPDCGSGADGRARPWDIAAQPSTSDLFGGADTDVGPAVDTEAVRDAVAAAILEAADSDHGAVPGWLRRWAEPAEVTPTVDWRRELAALTHGRRHRQGWRTHNWARPNRRGRVAPGGQVLLPSGTDPAPEVAVVLDTSGSMTAADLAASLAELAGLVRAHRTGAIRYLTCDSRASEARVARNLERLDLTGGGGTDMRVGIAAADRLRPRPEVIVVFTDGFTPWPDHAYGNLIAVLTDPMAPAPPDYITALWIPERIGGGVPPWQGARSVAAGHLGRLQAR